MHGSRICDFKTHFALLTQKIRVKPILSSVLDMVDTGDL